MNYAVAYYTRSGNTKKIADAIAEVIGVPTTDISQGLSTDVDVLFLGSSLYAFTYDPSVEKFIQENASKIKQIVSFSTSASGNSTAKFVKAAAEANGIAFYPQAFKCRGKFGFMNVKHPNDKDLDEARDFAKTVLSKLGE